MGVAATVGYNRFPTQGTYLGRRVQVHFDYDFKQAAYGKIVRDDTEPPFRTIIQLDDGRVITAGECQYAVL